MLTLKSQCDVFCQVLLWSRGKSLYEVRKFLGRPNIEKFEEIKEERKNSLLDEKIDIFSKGGSCSQILDPIIIPSLQPSS